MPAITNCFSYKLQHLKFGVENILTSLMDLPIFFFAALLFKIAAFDRFLKL